MSDSSSHPAYNNGLYQPSIRTVLKISGMERHEKREGRGIDLEKMVVPVLYEIQWFAIGNGSRVGTFAERHPHFILGTGIEHTQAIDRRLKAVDATQDLKMRNGKKFSKNILQEINAKTSENHIFVSCSIAQDNCKEVLSWWQLGVTITTLDEAIPLADLFHLESKCKKAFDMVYYKKYYNCSQTKSVRKSIKKCQEGKSASPSLIISVSRSSDGKGLW
ncbi:hypothetical protein Tco_0727777 [Tanacetum coccineum]|uniref:Uncharacterized protein n=1 Tax=Tanacetum coccineum TaxID=301880 RepID=A0ABQ4YLL4_9ASTR